MFGMGGMPGFCYTYVEQKGGRKNKQESLPTAHLRTLWQVYQELNLENLVIFMSLITNQNKVFVTRHVNTFLLQLFTVMKTERLARVYASQIDIVILQHKPTHFLAGKTAIVYYFAKICFK